MSLRLIVIVGPTACGKTRLAVDVAHALGSEIVSADSRQVYRGLDIGTGKDLEEYRRVTPPVPYHLIDVADPATAYSVYHYQRDCYAVLRDLHERPRHGKGTPLVMEGGTGLYVEAILRGYRIPELPEDVELRERLMRQEPEELIERLRDLDLARHERTDLSSKKRVVRALEIALHERDRGEVAASDPPTVPIDARVFCADLPREELHERIEERLHRRLAAGLVEEVQRLLDTGISATRVEQLGLEYREVAAYLHGTKSEAQMIEDLLRGIRRLAKRQRTWFRGMERRGIDVTWIRPDESGRILDREA
jgi:tRNA dimethylallyltransferase